MGKGEGEACSGRVRSISARKEKKNFIEYMKVFDDGAGEFDAEKVANLIVNRWGKRTVPKGAASKRPERN